MPLKWNNKILLIILVFFISCNIIAQDNTSLKSTTDQYLIEKQLNNKLSQAQKVYSRKREFYLKNQPLKRKLNPFNWIFGSMLFIYQSGISIQFSADCLYHPSCSNFCKDCLREHGLIKGLLLTSDRLGRCNRIAQSDLHPIKFDEEKHRFIDKAEYYK